MIMALTVLLIQHKKTLERNSKPEKKQSTEHVREEPVQQKCHTLKQSQRPLPEEPDEYIYIIPKDTEESDDSQYENMDHIGCVEASEYMTPIETSQGTHNEN